MSYVSFGGDGLHMRALNVCLKDYVLYSIQKIVYTYNVPPVMPNIMQFVCYLI